MCIRDRALVGPGLNLFFEFTEDGSSISFFDFFASWSPPLRDRKTVRVDVHRVYQQERVGADLEIERIKTIERVGSIEDLLITNDPTEGLLIDEIGGTVVRIYGEQIQTFRPYYPSEPTIPGDINMDELDYGDLILNFYLGIPNDLIFLGGNVTFPYVDTDQGRDYYSFNGNFGQDRIYEGEVILLQDLVTSLAVFQNRLVFADDDTLYFSEVNNYSNFTNFIDDTSPFFVRPNPISNQQPEIKQLFSSRGLFVVTDRGIYIVGYNQAITPLVPAISTVSDMPGINQCEMLDTNFFFKGEDLSLIHI